MCAANVTYHKVYTDGSCWYSKSHELARAGWGLVFHGSAFNCAYPLDWLVQTSYRAELKAVLQVLRCAKATIFIICGCRAVVSTLCQYLEGRFEGQVSDMAEQDL